MYKTKIGAGALGTVFLISDSKNGNTKNAKKALKKIKMPSPDIHHTVLREIHYLKFLSDIEDSKKERIANILDIQMKPQKISFTLEYGGVNLNNFIRKNPKWAKREQYLYEITKQSIEAMEFIHSFGLLHRDIKPANILLNFNPRDGTPQVKLCDLGLTKFVSKETALHTKLVCTANYRPPELFFDGDFWDWWEEQGGNTLDSYSERIDYWSLGISILEYIMGELVVPSDTEIGILKFITREFLTVPQNAKHELTTNDILEEINLIKVALTPVRKNYMYRVSGRLVDIHNKNPMHLQNRQIKAFLKNALKWDFRDRCLTFTDLDALKENKQKSKKAKKQKTKKRWLPKPVKLNIHEDIRHIYAENYFDAMRIHDISLEAVFIAIDIFDRFIALAEIDMNKLVMYSMTCLFIASKFQDYIHLPLESFTTQFSQREILEAECEILTAIDFRFNHVTFLDFIPYDIRKEEKARLLVLDYDQIRGASAYQIQKLLDF